jgi:hypothetical protein
MGRHSSAALPRIDLVGQSCRFARSPDHPTIFSDIAARSGYFPPIFSEVAVLNCNYPTLFSYIDV